ncbi:MAG: polysaccharide deacetylase family protein [Bacteroidales bacterium]|nr:polysaccharide deacetylase family protein [Bacteroidales bacterium]
MKRNLSNNIPVVYYHSVAPTRHPDWSKSFLTLEMKFFDAQLKYFSRHYQGVFLDEVYQQLRTQEAGGKPRICITFDDGYLDSFVYVYPLLKKYKIKATVFVSPEFVDPRPVVRPTLDDYWSGAVSMKNLNSWGFLSWDEMNQMVTSGWVDIQSHTMTHTKYFVSDKLTGFHHPGTKNTYPLWNRFPEGKPFYIDDRVRFESLLPFGFPSFEQVSAIIARRVEINPGFTAEVVDHLKDYPFHSYRFEQAFSWIKSIYNHYRREGTLLLSVETEEQYEKRIEWELAHSRRIIMEKLGKSVDFCCWPHGDNNHFAHRKAISLGYLASTRGKSRPGDGEKPYERIPGRIGVNKVSNNLALSTVKAVYKIRSAENRQPWALISRIYELTRKKA